MNRFTPTDFKDNGWFSQSDIEEIKFLLNFPSKFSKLLPVVQKIEIFATAASESLTGKFSDEALVELGSLFDELSKGTSGDDRDDLIIKAAALRNGYTDESIKALNEINPEISFVGGNISSWYGKRPGGFATCFANTRRPDLTEMTHWVNEFSNTTTDYLSELNKRLELSETPVFVVSDLVFMSGEGNGHPKHIAYFLPEDEGFKRSRIKKTHYFSNVHQAQIENISAPLLNMFTDLNYDRVDTVELAVLGVLGHEFGHFVTLPETNFGTVSAWDRWASIMYQEIAADVFGFLLLADLWGPLLGYSREASCTYYIGELLRYLNRGFGAFPDSDGMMFQLNYLREFSAVVMSDDKTTLRITSADAVIAAMRSLARTLTESLLKNDVDLLAKLSTRFGTDAPMTNDIVALLQKSCPRFRSLAYENA